MKQGTKIKKYGQSTGNAPKVWIETDADPGHSVEAIKRYYKVLGQVQEHRGIEKELDVAKIDECVKWFIKDYMEPRGLVKLEKHIALARLIEINATAGERKEIYRRLKDQGFDVWR